MDRVSEYQRIYRAYQRESDPEKEDAMLERLDYLWTAMSPRERTIASEGLMP